MIKIERIARITHAVLDRKAAETLYKGVFAAEHFHQGPLEAEGREGSLLALSNMCVEPVTPSERDPRVGRFIERFGQGLCSITFTVKDLDEAERSLRDQGVLVERRTPSHLVASGADCLGLNLEFIDRDLPNDPRLQAGWPGDRWREHPLGIVDPFIVTALTPDAELGAEVFGRLLGARVVYQRNGTVASRRNRGLGIGDGILNLMEPRIAEGPLAAVVQNQGATGIHALASHVKDFQQTTRYFASRGMGVVGVKDFYVMPHPRMCLGARFMLSRMFDPADPNWVGQQRFFGRQQA